MYTPFYFLGPQLDQQDEPMMYEDTSAPREKATRDELKSMAYKLIESEDVDQTQNDGFWFFKMQHTKLMWNEALSLNPEGVREENPFEWE